MNSRIEAKPTPSSLSRPLVQERLRPLARTPFYAARGVKARILRVWLKPARDIRAPSFVFSCGLSGTTLPGPLVAAYPEVRYLHEPCHFWVAVEPTTGFVQLHTRGEHHCLPDGSSVTAMARGRFSCLMTEPPGFTHPVASSLNQAESRGSQQVETFAASIGAESP
jgi:hypothetical protein